MNVNKTIVDFARSLAGITEIEGRNRNFTSDKFKEWLISVGWKEGQPYCSYTAEIVWKWSYSQWDSSFMKLLDRAFNGNAVRTFENFSKMYPELILQRHNDKPELGALAVFARVNKGVVQGSEEWKTGHIGVVVENKYNENFHLFEGNTFDKKHGREGNGNFINVHSYNEYYTDNGLMLLGFVNPIPV